MDDITAYLHESIEDDYLTRKEKRSLKALIAKNNLDQHQMNVLRSRIFDLAAEKINDSNYSFILQWLEEANKALVAPVEKRESDVLFSPGSECRNAIIRLIRGARKQLLVCVFTISDNEISRELIRAHEKGISVKILTDNDKLHDRGSDITEMARKGLPVRVDNTSDHMHHKFMVVDKETLLTGSYNWTRSAAERNHENILITTETQAVRAFVKEFEDLWPAMTVF